MTMVKKEQGQDDYFSQQGILLTLFLPANIFYYLYDTKSSMHHLQISVALQLSGTGILNRSIRSPSHFL